LLDGPFTELVATPQRSIISKTVVTEVILEQVAAWEKRQPYQEWSQIAFNSPQAAFSPLSGRYIPQPPKRLRRRWMTLMQFFQHLRSQCDG